MQPNKIKFFILVIFVSGLLAAVFVQNQKAKPLSLNRLSSSARSSPHQLQVEAIHQAGENIRLGGMYFKNGRHAEAILAYQKAYDLDPGNRIYAGLILVQAYEKLFRFDEAIAVLNKIQEENKISDYGIQQLALTRSRLLAAKQASSSSPQPTGPP